MKARRTNNREPRGMRRRVLVWLTIVMTMLSLTPAGFAVAQPQQPAQGQAVTQETQQYLEVHVVECPPGTAGSGQALFDTCHANGLADVRVNVASTDAALGINQDKVTERLNGAGPGIVNTGDIPAGEYQVTVDVPAEGNAFSIYCSVADGEDVIATTPDNAASATLTLTGTDVVCDWYVLPQEAAPLAKIDISMIACNERALEGDGRAWEDLSDACTDPARDVEVNLTSAATNAVTMTPVDATGKVAFPGLQPGAYTLYSDAPADTTDEFLFCEYAGQPRYEKDFNDRGVTTFTDLQGEQIACDWFVLALQDAPSTATATTPSTEPPAPTATASVTPTEPLEPSQDLTGQDVALGTIDVALRACPQDYDVAASGADAATFSQICTGPVTDVVMTLTTSQGVQTQLPSDSNGAVAFPNLQPDTYTLYSSIPLEAATEYVFCSVDGTAAPKELTDRGVATFTDLETEQVSCDWYVVPEDLRGEESGASLTVHLAACPVEYAGGQLFNDCHGNGVADMSFTLTGPAGEQTATTELPQTPGPGVTTFTELPAGDYALAGGPPGDFGRVDLYCSDQATNERIATSVDSTIATFAIGENQDILCDWYFIPDNASGVTPTPTPTEKPRAEILVTLYECASTNAASGYAGASYDQLKDACTAPVNDVTFTLGDVGAPPLSAATGVSGEGAVRFYDLLPADYTLTPSLPSDLTSAAVYCRIGEGDVYQKSLQNGATTFVDVDGEQISCDWFAAPVRQPQPQPSGPTGSITVREYLCEKDRSEITDWERECTPGSTGTSFTLNSSDGAVTLQATPDAKGVLVFSELPDGFYDLTQDDGVWCRAAAERVDSRSRVIVRDGGNTDVFIYECGQVHSLPSTGSGATQGHEGGSLPSPAMIAALGLAALAIPTFAAGVVQVRRVRKPVPVEVQARPTPRRTVAGTHWIRFR